VSPSPRVSGEGAVGIVQRMRIETLDHVALWVSDRDTLADFLTAHVGMRVIERTEKFTLVGSDARRGKLTLFEAEGEREPGSLLRVGLRVSSLKRALAQLPRKLEVERHAPGQVSFTAPERLGLGLVEADGDLVEYDIDHVAFLVRDPAAAREELLGLGFSAANGRLRAGDSFVELVEGEAGEPVRPLLNHLGLRVESAADHISEARSRGLEIADIVDAPNTYAVFVWGPERIKLEYVEHKASFSLV
jgi:catechol 2,3-dioxygenase-like lactoylglutathione lyase family enzyme